MTTPMTFECDVHFRRRGRGARRQMEEGRAPTPPTSAPGRVPRVARLMALALRFEEQVRRGEPSSYAELADLGHVSRARISQIMNLLNLAPDVQEALLFLPLTERGRDSIHLRLLQPIASTFDWKKQRRQWEDLLRTQCGSPAH
jgi:hypothetical protein